MDHPNLTQREIRIVRETCGRLGAQLLSEQIPTDRSAQIVLALTVELASLVLRLTEGTELHDTERPPPT